MGGSAVADEGERATGILVNQLGAGPRTRAQLAAVLTRRGVDREHTETVLDRFTELGYIDDAAFADAWVRARSASRGLSGRALAHELAAKGVAPDLVARALSGLSAEDELAAAREVAVRRSSRMAGLPHDVRLRRLVGLLARRGHGPAIAFRLAGEVLASEQPDPTSSAAGPEEQSGPRDTRRPWGERTAARR